MMRPAKISRSKGIVQGDIEEGTVISDFVMITQSWLACAR